MTRIAELQDRLHRLAKRREDEGIYTDANLVEAASSRIAELEAEVARLTFANNTLTLAAEIAAKRCAKAEALSRTVAVKVKALVNSLLDLRDLIMRGKRCVTDTGPAVKPVIELAAVHILDDAANALEALSALEPAARDTNPVEDHETGNVRDKPAAPEGQQEPAAWQHIPNCGVDRESKMVHVTGKVFCDPCVAPLIAALNAASIETVASCCGHGHRPGVIVLRDGRELFIAKDFDESRKVDAAFPTDINGNTRPSEQAVTEAMVEAAAASLRPDLFTPLDPADLRSDDFAWTRREEAKANALHKARAALKAAMEAGRHD